MNPIRNTPEFVDIEVEDPKKLTGCEYFKLPVGYSHGHSVLRLPPYHPELNHIEEIWATVKNWVVARNVTFKLKDVEALARQTFAEVTVEEWLAVWNHAHKFEMDFMKKEHLLDDSLRFVINLAILRQNQRMK